jgi:hypothetical protein
MMRSTTQMDLQYAVASLQLRVRIAGITHFPLTPGDDVVLLGNHREM